MPSTGRQTDGDLSIPDQRRQAKGYCTSREGEVVDAYAARRVGRWRSAAQFPRMIDAATTKPPAFDVILVLSCSRFFRDQFQLEFYVRPLPRMSPDQP